MTFPFQDGDIAITQLWSTWRQFTAGEEHQHAAPEVIPIPFGASIWYHPSASPDEAMEQMWTWRPIDRGTAAIEEKPPEVHEPEWLCLPDADQDLLPILRGQLAILHEVRFPGSQRHIWVRREDMARARAFPVTLGFTLPALPDSYHHQIADIRWLTISIALPPLMMGSVASIQVPLEQHQGYSLYPVQALGEDGIHLQRQLMQTLIALAAPCVWSPYMPDTKFCLMDGGYDLRYQTLQAASRVDATKRKALQAEMTRLEQQRSVAEAIRAARQHFEEAPDQWLAQWQSAQGIAAELVQVFWSNHQGVIRRSFRVAPPTEDVFKDQERVPVPVTDPFLAVLLAISDAQEGAPRWRPHEEGLAFSKGGQLGTTHIQLRFDEGSSPLDPNAIDSLWQRVRTFSDPDGDVALAMLAHAFGGAQTDEQGEVWITGGRMLEYRGIQPIMKKEGDGPPRRAGFRQEDLAEIAERVERIGRIWITLDQIQIEEPGKKSRRRKRRFTHESRFVQISEVIRQHELPAENDVIVYAQADATTKSFAIAWHYRFGTWIKPFLEVQSRQTAWIMRQALRYDPYRELWEKRLARYFIFRLRLAAAHGNATIIAPIGALFQELNLPIDQRNPERTRTRFEQAMNRLRADHQIDGWGYTLDCLKLPAKKWLEAWLIEWRIQVSIQGLSPVIDATEEIALDEEWVQQIKHHLRKPK